MSHCEVIRDDDGTVIATVQVTKRLTDEERTALAAFFKAVRDQRLSPSDTEQEQQ